MPHSFRVISACWPIERPVLGSLKVLGSDPLSHSTPPAIPALIRPAAMASAMMVVVRKPVMQYEETVCASIWGGKPSSKTISRARLGLPRSGTTAPKAMASIPSGWKLWRSRSPRTAWFPSAAGLRDANAFPDFTKGVRAPATMATLGLLIRLSLCLSHVCLQLSARKVEGSVLLPQRPGDTAEEQVCPHL